MTRRSFCVLFALAVVIGISACDSPSKPTDPELVTLAPGASATSGALKLTFVGITGDSRCPGDAVCITAGDAQAAIEAELLGLRRSAELYLVDPSKRSITLGSYTIRFDALSPYPFLSLGPIAPASYRATFQISRQ